MNCSAFPPRFTNHRLCRATLSSTAMSKTAHHCMFVLFLALSARGILPCNTHYFLSTILHLINKGQTKLLPNKSNNIFLASDSPVIGFSNHDC